MIYANKLQTQLILAESPIVLLSNGRGAGHTYGCFLKMLETRQVGIKFYFPLYKILRYTVKDFTGFLFDNNIKYFHNTANNVVSFTINGVRKEVKFLTPAPSDVCSMNLGYGRIEGGLTIIDQVEMFPKYFTDYILKVKHLGQLIFTTQPFYCGWRNPKFEYGAPVIEDGRLVVEEASWDYSLINWAAITNCSMRATPFDYKRNVEVITGYNACNLLQEDFNNCIANLPESDRLRVGKDWIEGFCLVEGEIK